MCIQRIVAGLIVLLSLHVNAHSQYPSEIKQNVLSEITQVENTLTNMYDKPMCYVKLQNNQPTPERYCLKAHESVKLKTLVRNLKDKVAINEICTLSDNLTNTVRTQVCTTVKTYYPYSYLQQALAPQPTTE